LIPLRVEAVGMGATRAGLLGGIVAASLLALFRTLVALLQGRSPARFAAEVAAFVFPNSTVSSIPPTLAVIVALSAHLGIGAALGILYARLASRNVSVGTDLLSGIAFGVVVYFVMTRAVLPWANPILAASEPGFWCFVGHVLFGATLGLVVPLRRGARGGLERPVQRPTLV
jgi:hypothetical protein